MTPDPAPPGALPGIAGLRLMSFGLVMGERDAVLSDPALVGRLVVQTLRDVDWGDLDVLLLDLPPGSGEPVEVFHRTSRPWAIEGESLEMLGEVPLDVAFSRGVGEGQPAPAFQEIAGRLRARLR